MFVLLGALLGLAVGGSAEGFDGALAGAVLGGLAGAVMQAVLARRAGGDATRRLAEAERRIDHIYQSLEHIHYRLEEIERRVGSAPRPMEAAAPVGAAPAPAAEDVAGTALPAREVAPAIAVALSPGDSGRVSDRDRPDERETARADDAHDAAPREPAAWQRWLLGGNTLVRVGVVILFFGVAFLAKYAAETFTVPVELRLAGIAAAGIALFALGWRLRFARPGYGLTLQGGGIGVMYLTVFAALRLYGVLPAPLAFALLLALVAASAVLAVRQESQALAVLGAAGGFLAPILASTGQGSHVLLFAYYVVLNLGILGVAWTRAWRPLNLLGFAFTFVIAAAWGTKFYRPEHYATTQPFLAAFFLMYVGIAVLYATRRSIALRHYVDGTLVFGTPLVAFALQSQLVRGMPGALAFSALAVAALYLGLAWWLRSRRGDGLRLLFESFLGLGVVFLTLAIPLALDGRWTSAAWALEGAAIVWAASRQGRRLGQWFGVALQPVAAVAFLDATSWARAAQPIANADFLGGAFLAVAGVFAARVIARRPESFGRGAGLVSTGLLWWGAGWALATGANEVRDFLPARYEPQALLGLAAAWAALFAWLARHLSWRAALGPAAALVPLMVAAAALAVVVTAHPFARGGWASWLAAFAVAYAFLRVHEDDLPPWLARTTHAVAAWLAIALLSWEVAWQIDRAVRGHGTWPFVAWALVPGAALAVLTLLIDRAGWPMEKHRRLYAVLAAAPVAAYLWGWLLVANVASDGDASPLPYAPLLNPLDLAGLAALLALVAWYVALRRRGMAASVAPSHAAIAVGIAGFAWVNGVLLRTLHHWAGVPYRLDDMLRSTLAQTSISVFWTVLAVAAMLLATRSARRPVWVAGAGLLGVVVLKLFMFDLSRLAGVERIVSFLAVGVLLLAIGYFSPVPPRRASAASGEVPPA
jgi:uncharacterized membrane protein